MATPLLSARLFPRVRAPGTAWGLSLFLNGVKNRPRLMRGLKRFKTQEFETIALYQRNGLPMRAEIENLTSEIKQSLELLRRHL